MAVSVLITTASICIFLVVFWITKVVAVARRAITIVRGALQAMRDPQLDEMARERSVQAAAMQLLLTAASLTLRSLVALASALAPIFAADWAGVASQAETFAFMERWDVILGATAIITIGYLARVFLWSR